MVSTISRQECIHQTTLNCNITPNISSILQRLFHGGRTEAARQHGGPPWYDANIMNKTGLQFCKDWGFNVVRLGAMRSGVEPTERQINAMHLDVLEI